MTGTPVAGGARADVALPVAWGYVDGATALTVARDGYTCTGALLAAGVGAELWITDLDQSVGKSRAQNSATRLQT